MSQSRRRARSAASSRRPSSGSARPVTLHAGNPHRDVSHNVNGFLVAYGWNIALIALVVGVALHFGVLDWFTGVRITNPDGSSERLPNTFASIDHPFHIAKERAVLDALREGSFPRWISNHQAGYPAEFYPLGADMIVAIGWAAGFGLVPLEVVHKLVVIAVLFIPVVAYWSIARRDRWPASVAVVAAVLHLFVPGGWLGGGPDELLRMGMWPNVFASYLMLPVMLWSADFLRRDSRRGFVLAALVAALAIYTNPRALIAVTIVVSSVGIVALIERRHRRGAVSSLNQPRLRRLQRTDWEGIAPLVGRVLLLATAILLLCSALILPLRSRQDLYAFTRFVEFSSLANIWEYFTTALPIEIWMIAILGAGVAARGSRFHTRVLAIWLLVAALTIVTIGWVLRDLAMFEQLEAPRLLPIVRLPAIFLAAVGIHGIVTYVVQVTTSRDYRSATGIMAVAVTALVVLTPISPLSPNERGLETPDTTDQPAFVAIEHSARVYERNTSSDDRSLIVGSTISEHSSFWIPALTGSDAFHTAWVWNWHTPAYADQTRVADVASTLDLAFLRGNGLTMVLIATAERDLFALATTRPYLHLIDPGTAGGYAIFRVDDGDRSTRGPVAISNGNVTSLDVSREHLKAHLNATKPTQVAVSINDYPAWRAKVNGVASPIHRSDDGYMLFDVPAGDTDLELDFVVEPVVWYGRVLSMLGLLLVLAVAIMPGRGNDSPGLQARASETRVRYRSGRGGTRDQHE